MVSSISSESLAVKQSLDLQLAYIWTGSCCHRMRSTSAEQHMGCMHRWPQA